MNQRGYCPEKDTDQTIRKAGIAPPAAQSCGPNNLRAPSRFTDRTLNPTAGVPLPARDSTSPFYSCRELPLPSDKTDQRPGLSFFSPPWASILSPSALRLPAEVAVKPPNLQEVERHPERAEEAQAAVSRLVPLNRDLGNLIA